MFDYRLRTTVYRLVYGLRATVYRIVLMVLTLVVGSLWSALPALAVEEIGEGALTRKLRRAAETGAGLAYRSPVGYAGAIARGALIVVGLIFFILTVYGGFLYLTAGGNEDQVTKSKTILRRAAIGLLIVIFAGAITQFITTYFRPGGAPGE